MRQLNQTSLVFAKINLFSHADKVAMCMQKRQPTHSVTKTEARTLIRAIEQMPNPVNINAERS